MKIALKALVVLVGLTLCVQTADARGRRSGGGGGGGGGGGNPALTNADVKDGLDVVNARRKAMGLHPFIRNDKLFPFTRDQALRQGRGGFCGHNGCNLGDGCSAEGVGTASAGGGDWNSCCWTENYREAAAAYTEVGGTRYCAIHVLGGGSSGGGSSRRGRR